MMLLYIFINKKLLEDKSELVLKQKYEIERLKQEIINMNTRSDRYTNIHIFNKSDDEF